ncbi:YadA-like family protein [Proteus mirabilis]|uniref:YadA C-terminal domain-containing protein n=1 Tax=Proteus TaxID=583 RepID=UPI0018C80720|nr:YadA-like family protein [Proteus vulgaris]MBG3080205.1 YadA-like family protein [Proteus mirabilis]QPN91300.1 YadA-like family protein [Proteus vulgaris]
MKYSKLFIILLSSILSTNALSNTHAELNSKEAPVNFDNHYPDMPNEISKSELDNFYDIRRLYIKYFNPIQSQKENYENAKKIFSKKFIYSIGSNYSVDDKSYNSNILINTQIFNELTDNYLIHNDPILYNKIIENDNKIIIKNLSELERLNLSYFFENIETFVTDTANNPTIKERSTNIVNIIKNYNSNSKSNHVVITKDYRNNDTISEYNRTNDNLEKNVTLLDLITLSDNIEYVASLENNKIKSMTEKNIIETIINKNKTLENKEITEKNKIDIKSNKENIEQNKIDISNNKEKVDKYLNTLDIAGYPSDITGHFSKLYSKDVVTKSRLDVLESDFKHFKSDTQNRFYKVEKRANQGIASVAAMSNLPFTDSATFSTAIGIGNYRNATALAWGMQYRINENVKVRASTAWNDSNSFVSAGGIGISW